MEKKVRNGFLPVTPEEVKEDGITQLDFVYISGDAYVDHPSFGAAIITRLLQSRGYSVGMIAQPDWKKQDSIMIFGKPRLGFLISAGNMDSMVNHYYVSKKHRETDAYSPGGTPYLRPDHAAVVYSNLVRKVYRDVPIILGGIEPSLRRMAHYDYWSDSFKRSILLDSQADLISYGMGEKSIVEIADALNSGLSVSDLSFIKGTVYRTKNREQIIDGIELPSYDAMKEDKLLYAKGFAVQHTNTDAVNGRILIEPYPQGIYVVQNPPQSPLSMQEMDDVYALPYMRTYHPMYQKAGGIPAISEIKFSLTSNRGCFGGCNFCALTFHQGRTVQVRSHESILEEAKKIIQEPDFKGYIHDVGGPTANFRHPSCEKQLKCGVCQQRQCLVPTPCKNMTIDHMDYLALLRKLRALDGVKKVFIRSGIRFDYLIEDKDDTFFRELVQYHISGQLKVAPEHISNQVLSLMGKPGNEVYEKFRHKYLQFNEFYHKNQFIVPYLMSSHPGSTIKDAIKLAEYLRDLGYMPQQVQDFYPTPSTVSTVMYYTGVDPMTMKNVYVCKNPHEKAMQRALIQYKNPKNRELVEEALHLGHREDLIGFSKNCLIKPDRRDAQNFENSKDKRPVNREYLKQGGPYKRSTGKQESYKENSPYKRNTGKQESYKENSPYKRNTGKQESYKENNPFRKNPLRQENVKKTQKKTIRNIHKKK